MLSAGAVDEVRRALGPVGAFVGVTGTVPHDQREGVRRLEGAGYPALWTNEVVGSDAMVRASLWLAATQHVVVATCVANVWARPAPTAHAAATQLAQAHPGRFVLGLGVSHPHQAASVGRTYGSPVVTAREYLLQMGEPVGDCAYPRILAANGPRMLALAAQVTDGALPAGAPSATAAARAALGASKLLVVFVPVALSGPAGAVARAVGEHLDAGADHVVVGASYTTDPTAAINRLQDLAPTLTTHRS